MKSLTLENNGCHSGLKGLMENGCQLVRAPSLGTFIMCLIYAIYIYIYVLNTTVGLLERCL